MECPGKPLAGLGGLSLRHDHCPPMTLHTSSVWKLYNPETLKDSVRAVAAHTCCAAARTPASSPRNMQFPDR